MRTIEWKNGTVITVDQTQLPHKTVFLKMTCCHDVEKAIRTMKIRGAPLLGAAAGYGLALTAYHSTAEEKRELIEELAASARDLRRTRPTAVNLFWAIERIMSKAEETDGNAATVARAVVEEAGKIADQDVRVNRRIGEIGSKLIEEKDTILTHCNAGRLATVDHGTALAIVRAAWTEGKRFSVMATETRPLLQGARLTAYELHSDGIPITLITDNMVGHLMYGRLVDKVMVGADRIVKDAVINKIGTYQIAVLAHKHRIPFYVAAPTSTFDTQRLAKDITVEHRNAEEVTKFQGVQVAPKGVPALNPAFDITPLEYVSAIICEKGIIHREDYEKSLVI
jgi:methylthioribose-1-phosphate isomerase